MYSSQIVPYLVFKCDETALEDLAGGLLATPLSTLLRDSLPVTMSLILTNHAQQDRQDNIQDSQERRKKATDAHNLLTKHLTQEVCVTCIHVEGESD